MLASWFAGRQLRSLIDSVDSFPSVVCFRFGRIPVEKVARIRVLASPVVFDLGYAYSRGYAKTSYVNQNEIEP
jgi:hypothetical protein